VTRLERVRRRLDRAFYRLLFRLYRRLFPCDVPPGRVPSARVRRVLVVRHDAVGDMAVTLPALSYLRVTLPHAEIDVVASPRNEALLRGDGRVRRVYVNDHSRATTRRLTGELRERRYDAIVSPLMRHGLREGLFAARIAHRATARITPWRQTQYLGLFTHPCRVSPCERHMAKRLLALVQRTIGDAPPPVRADVAAFPPGLAHDAAADARVDALLSSRVRGPFVALNAWAAEAHRALGGALAAELAAGIASRGAAVVLTPPPGRASEADAIVDAVRARDGDAAVTVAPPGSLHDLVALLRRAAVVVTPDTANVHLASAVGTPVVSMHTPIGADVRDWGPWGVPNRTVVLREPRPLSDVRAEDVLAALDSLWAELHHR
jgi:heptosyltransferase III